MGSGIALLIGALTTFALSSIVTINTSKDINFAQGTVQTTTCDTYLVVKLSTSLNESNTYDISSITISDISTQLHDKRVRLILNDQNGNPLSASNLYFDVDSTGTGFTSPLTISSTVDYMSSGGGPLHEIGASSVTLSNIRNINNAPISALSVHSIALQTTGNGGCTPPAISCANGGTCSLGDVGPGGGPVIYVASTPFREPVSGKSYKYIEAAPPHWHNATTNDPSTATCNNTSAFSGTSLSVSIGYAVSNTNTLYANSSCIGIYSAPSTTPSGIAMAAQLVRGYGSGWNIPTYNELNEMCKVARWGAVNAPSHTNCSETSGNPNATPAGWGVGDIYWNYASSSKTTTAGQIHTMYLSTGVGNPSSAPINSAYAIRPIRYFG